MKTYTIILQSTKEVPVYTYHFLSAHYYDAAISNIKRFGGMKIGTTFQFSTESQFANCNAAIAALYAKQVGY